MNIESTTANERIPYRDAEIIVRQLKGAHFDLRNLGIEKGEDVDAELLVDLIADHATESNTEESGEPVSTKILPRRTYDWSWDEFVNSGKWRMSKVEYQQYLETGDFPDWWDDELHARPDDPVETTNPTEVDISPYTESRPFFYDRNKIPLEEQQAHYLEARRQLDPIVKKMRTYRAQYYSAAGAMILSTALAAAVGVQLKNQLLAQAGFGGSAVAAFGYRRRKRGQASDLEREKEPLYAMVKGFELEHSGDKQFFLQHGIDHKEVLDTQDPYAHNVSEEYEPDTGAQKAAEHISQAVEASVYAIQDALL